MNIPVIEVNFDNDQPAISDETEFFYVDSDQRATKLNCVIEAEVVMETNEMVKVVLTCWAKIRVKGK